ncbi:hypothetical protein AAHA92_04395 [Salvia divinorum]|uniref:Uncharacterized protein n=1 Tax=Salvia divinorum TaxID=28513 RepID=A0ABD1HZ24_SALDI
MGLLVARGPPSLCRPSFNVSTAASSDRATWRDRRSRCRVVYVDVDHTPPCPVLSAPENPNFLACFSFSPQFATFFSSRFYTSAGLNIFDSVSSQAILY